MYSKSHATITITPQGQTLSFLGEMSDSKREGKCHQKKKLKKNSSSIQISYLSKQKEYDSSSSSDKALSTTYIKSARHSKEQNENTTSSSDESSEMQDTPLKYKSKFCQHSHPSKKVRRKEISHSQSQRPQQILYEFAQSNPQRINHDVSVEEFPDESNDIPQPPSSDENSNRNDFVDMNNEPMVSCEDSFVDNNTDQSTSSETSDSDSSAKSLRLSSESSTENDEENEQACDLNEMLYGNNDISTGAAYLIILKFCIKYKLSRKARNNLLRLISILVPRNTAKNISKTCGKLITNIIPSMEKVEKHLICSVCNEVLI